MRCSSKRLPEIARCLRAPAILGLFFSPQSKQIVQTQISSPCPAAGTAPLPQSALGCSIPPAPRWPLGQGGKGEAHGPPADGEVQHWVCDGSTAGPIPALGCAGSAGGEGGGSGPRGSSRCWDISHRGRAEQEGTTPAPRVITGERKDEERCRWGVGQSPCPKPEVVAGPGPGSTPVTQSHSWGAIYAG